MIIFFFSAITASTGTSFWAGGSDIAEEGKWVWTNNSTIDCENNYCDWHEGEPNDSGHYENCLEVYHGQVKSFSNCPPGKKNLPLEGPKAPLLMSLEFCFYRRVQNFTHPISKALQ